MKIKPLILVKRPSLDDAIITWKVRSVHAGLPFFQVSF